MTSAFELIGRDPSHGWVTLRVKVIVREGQGFQVLLEEDEALAVGSQVVLPPAELGEWPVLTHPWTGKEVRGEAALKTSPAVSGGPINPLAHQAGVALLELPRLLLDIFASCALAVFQSEAFARGLPSKRTGTALEILLGTVKGRQDTRRRLHVVVRVECPASLEVPLEDVITGARPSGNPLEASEGKEEPVPPPTPRPGTENTPFPPLAFPEDDDRWGLHLEAFIEAEAEREKAGDDAAKRRKVRRDIDIKDSLLKGDLAAAAKDVLERA